MTEPDDFQDGDPEYEDWLYRGQILTGNTAEDEEALNGVLSELEKMNEHHPVEDIIQQTRDLIAEITAHRRN